MSVLVRTPRRSWPLAKLPFRSDRSELGSVPSRSDAHLPGNPPGTAADALALAESNSPISRARRAQGAPAGGTAFWTRPAPPGGRPDPRLIRKLATRPSSPAPDLADVGGPGRGRPAPGTGGSVRETGAALRKRQRRAGRGRGSRAPWRPWPAQRGRPRRAASSKSRVAWPAELLA